MLARISFDLMLLIAEFSSRPSELPAVFGFKQLKDIITRFKGDQAKKKVILSLLDSKIDLIVQNPYGNYAIQHVIDVMDPVC